MEVTLALLADAANFSQEGKLNVLGEFDTIFAATFPVAHPEMQLVMRFEASPAEYGQRKQIEIKLLSEDGVPLGVTQGALEVPQGHGRRSKIVQVLGLRGVTFPKPGEYAFYILVDGRTEERVPVLVVERQP